MSRLSDLLFGLGTDLAKYPSDSEDDALNRRVVLRKALTEWGDERYREGYGDGRRDLLDSRIEAKQRRGGVSDD